MAGEAEAVGQVPRDIGKGLTHKIGPLPVWGWVLVGGVVVVVGYLAYSAYSNSQNGTNLASGLPFLGGSGTPEGSSTGSTDTTPAVVTPLTASGFISKYAAQIASQTGESLSQVELYLNDLFNGVAPVGVPGASTAFGNVVAAAQAISDYPVDIVPTGTPKNAYGSTADYLNSLLTYLPSGTSQSVINEIINLYNGATTTISQDAANALSAGQSVVGLGPIPVVYSLIPANVTTTQLQSLASSPYLSGTYSDPNAAFNAWQGFVRSYVPSLASASSNDLLYLFNQINLSFQGGSSASPYAGTNGSANLANFINTQILPNLGKLPTQTNVTQYRGIVGQVSTVPLAA